MAAENTSVTTRLNSLQRSATPRFSIDIESDGSGAPALSYDQSGAANAITVTGRRGGKLSVAVAGAGSSFTVDTALRDEADMLALAGVRATLGRSTTVVPSSVTVDATTSVADLTADLLDDLRAGDTVQVTGLPSDVIGYSTISCVVVGVVETHNLSGSRFALSLMPLVPL